MVNRANRIGLRFGFRPPSAVGETGEKPLGDELLPVETIGSGVVGEGSRRGGRESYVAGCLAARRRGVACELRVEPRFDTR